MKSYCSEENGPRGPLLCPLQHICLWWLLPPCHQTSIRVGVLQCCPLYHACASECVLGCLSPGGVFVWFCSVVCVCVLAAFVLFLFWFCWPSMFMLPHSSIVSQWYGKARTSPQRWRASGDPCSAVQCARRQVMYLAGFSLIIMSAVLCVDFAYA